MKILILFARRLRSVILERAEHAGLLLTPPRRVIEPELVADDPAAQLGAEIPAGVDRIAGSDALRDELRIDVAALEGMSRRGKKAAAVEVVAPALQDHVDLNPMRRAVGVVAYGLHRRFLDGGVVFVIAALRAGLRPRAHHAFQRRPGFTQLAERLEKGIAGDKAPFQLWPGTGSLQHQRDDAVAAGGNDLEGLSRQLRATGRGRDVHDRRGARDRDRFGEAADAHFHVELGLEPEGQPDVAAPKRLKALEGEFDDIGADRQRRKAVFAALVGDVDHRGHLQRRTRRGHRHAGQRGAGLVRHLPEDAGFLRPAREGQETREQHEEDAHPPLGRSMECAGHHECPP